MIGEPEFLNVENQFDESFSKAQKYWLDAYESAKLNGSKRKLLYRAKRVDAIAEILRDLRDINQGELPISAIGQTVCRNPRYKIVNYKGCFSCIFRTVNDMEIDAVIFSEVHGVQVSDKKTRIRAQVC